MVIRKSFEISLPRRSVISLTYRRQIHNRWCAGPTEKESGVLMLRKGLRIFDGGREGSEHGTPEFLFFLSGCRSGDQCGCNVLYRIKQYRNAVACQFIRKIADTKRLEHTFSSSDVVTSAQYDNFVFGVERCWIRCGGRPAGDLPVLSCEKKKWVRGL